MAGRARDDGQGDRGFFDLNVEQVLEHRTVAHAVRELLANALDEHLLGHGGPPEVAPGEDGNWHIRDFGRGLSHEHFTQNENPEKLESADVIGRFGVGLKDALAVLHRWHVPLRIHTAEADITTAMHPKAGFDDTITLHAHFEAPTRPAQPGTDVVLGPIDPDTVVESQRFFRHWNAETELDRTPYGAILHRRKGEPASIYVRGVRVAEEDTFLFSYDITDINAPLARALNRERSHVGRTAYAARVKDILLASTAQTVMERLTGDLDEYETGDQHTESSWVDIAVHASRVLNERDDVVFVTPAELAAGGATVDHARDDGKRIVVVPDTVRSRLANETDSRGDRIRTLQQYIREREESFEFTFVTTAELTAAERSVYDTAELIFDLSGVKNRWPVLITETMRPGMPEREQGLWDPARRRIIIHRDQLRSPADWAGTLLHEIVHATTGHDDATLPFEEALSAVLGHLADQLVSQGPSDQDEQLHRT